MRAAWVIGALVAALAMVAGCGADGASSNASSPAVVIDAGDNASPSAATDGPSPIPALPTLRAPSTPPRSPTDVTSKDVVAGTVVSASPTCTRVRTDDGAVWALAGEPRDSLSPGDVVLAKTAPPGPDEEPCGEGMPARLVEIERVG